LQSTVSLSIILTVLLQNTRLITFWKFGICKAKLEQLSCYSCLFKTGDFENAKSAVKIAVANSNE